VKDLSRLCWELGYSVKKAEKVDGVIYAFVITANDGMKTPFRYGKELMKFLREKKGKTKIPG